ncbi:glycosyltransferase [Methylacidimicrobium sp. B4]|uniref:glycosyltransferase n=1 Tax=Methylacidimicrobium sp. B4 TaxID=2796139 RepID=UPI001A8CD585|nr:glycosyltransferase [Methylacidimicrobium sp. B4]QSR84386.1 glycosyltransferase [Methylacidimicrobium sp. B4]
MSNPPGNAGAARSGPREWASGADLLGILPWFPLPEELPIFLDEPFERGLHIPFACWLMAALRPVRLVYVGKVSSLYLAFCEAAKAAGMATRAWAVDAGGGSAASGSVLEPEADEELRRFHDQSYRGFSEVLSPDEARAPVEFPEGSIDLLCLGGSGAYETVREEFRWWLPKLSPRAVVLLPGATDYRSQCGAWRFWKEVRSAYPSALFPHGRGLGVLLSGPEPHDTLRALAHLREAQAARVRWFFARQGERCMRGILEGRMWRTLSLDAEALVRKIGDDPLWRLLGRSRLLSRGATEALGQASLLAGELLNDRLALAEGEPKARALEASVERFLSSRSFLGFLRLRRWIPLPRADRRRESVADARRAWQRSVLVAQRYREFLRARSPEEAPRWRDSLGYPLEPGVSKERVRERYQEELERFLAGGDRLLVPSPPEPELSVVLVLYNQAELTYACLRSLAIHLCPSAEVVVVDNASSDRTGELLERIEGARIFRNRENLHFLRAANQGAAAARGRLLLFLNSDAQILSGTVEAARQTIEGDRGAGAVVGRLVNLDGTLQEAGAFFLRDGIPCLYGAGENPQQGAYLYRRETDYGSGAFLLTHTPLFGEMGGFDECFSPAYCEDSDYCLRLWEKGWRVLYEPEAVVLHWLHGSSASGQAREWAERNRTTFAKRHELFLRDRQPHRPGFRPSLAFPRPKIRLLYIDDRVPRPELGSGFPRSNAVLRALAAWGAQVTLFPMSGCSEEWEEIYWSVPREVEVLRDRDASSLQAYLEARGGDSDCVWVSRPHNMASFLEAAQGRGFRGRARLVYDAEALFAFREIREAEILGGKPLPKEERSAQISKEIALARSADRVVAVSEVEAREFQRQGIADVRVIGHVLELAPTASPYEQRQDLLIVGAVHALSSPNGDALVWFARTVLPRIRAGFPDAPPRLVVVGYGTDAPELRRLLGPEVVTAGTVADLAPYYERARLFLAPTRFAAGIPHKAHEAAARGVPIVASDLIAGQLGWITGEELVSAPVDDPAAFAEACLRLYRDRSLWERVRAGALAAVARDCDAQRFSQGIHALLEELVGEGKRR